MRGGVSKITIRSGYLFANSLTVSCIFWLASSSVDKPAPAELPVETVIAEEKEFINKKAPLDEFVIDFVRLDKNGHISLNGERKQINEEYREIKRKLLANAFGSLAKTLHNPNIIMVTSSRPSEGKTFTATNLAMSIASEQDKTVLLVDADVLKPNVLNTLGLERRKGLMEYLTGDVDDISDVLYPTNIDKLKIIPAENRYISITPKFSGSANKREVFVTSSE